MGGDPSGKRWLASKYRVTSKPYLLHNLSTKTRLSASLAGKIHCLAPLNNVHNHNFFYQFRGEADGFVEAFAKGLKGAPNSSSLSIWLRPAVARVPPVLSGSM